MQYVGVKFRSGPDRTYSYEWHGDKDLTLGQRVIVPPNYLNPMPSFADVVVIYNGRHEVKYSGELAHIMDVVDDGVQES